MIDEIKIRNYIRALINPYGKPFEGTAYELGLKIMKYIEGMEKANYPLSDCIGDCKNCWKTKLVNQPKVGEWIPCSERLPQEDESVLITTKTTDKIYFGTYTKRYGFSMREGFICGDGFMWLNTAVAWMPLPQPYKGEQI